MDLEKFEKIVKSNKFSFILIPVFIVGIIYSIPETWFKVNDMYHWFVVKETKPVVSVESVNKIEERIKTAKMESVNYKIPSSSTFIAKFITYPMLNHFDKNIFGDSEATHAILTSVSPLKAMSQDNVFDGGDCRFGVEAKSYSKTNKSVKFKVVSITCTDNNGIAYNVEPKNDLGYVSYEDKPGIDKVASIQEEGMETVDLNRNYLIQLYHPIHKIQKKGISFVGRF